MKFPLRALLKSENSLVKILNFIVTLVCGRKFNQASISLSGQTMFPCIGHLSIPNSCLVDFIYQSLHECTQHFPIKYFTDRSLYLLL